MSMITRGTLPLIKSQNPGICLLRVHHRHIENRVQLFAHRRQHKGHAAGLGLEQVSER